MVTVNKPKYYDSSRVLSKQYNLNMIIGPRGYGKTYGYKKYCINKAINGEGKFIYMRRKKSEIDAITDFFGDLRNDPKFVKQNIVFDKRGYELFFAYDDDRDENDRHNWNHIGTLFPLSTEATMKSREFPEYENLIFDEWLPLTAGEFLRNEPKKFASALDTVFRLREFNVFCIGNSSILFNPYFEYFNIYPNLAKEFTYNKERSILIQVISSEEWAETRTNSPLGRLINGTEYADYANENQFTDDDDSLVEDKPAKAKNIMVFKLEGYTVGVWRDFDNGMVYFSEQYNETIPDKYAFDFEEIDAEYQPYRNLFDSPNINILKVARQRGKIRFTSKKAKAHSRAITSRIHLL